MSLATREQQSAAPVTPLEAMRERCDADDETWRRLEREVQQHQEQRAQHWSAYRHALAEVRRILPLFRQMHQASSLALYQGNTQVQDDAQRLRHALAALVGEAEVERIASEPAYNPSWLHAR